MKRDPANANVVALRLPRELLALIDTFAIRHNLTRAQALRIFAVAGAKSDHTRYFRALGYDDGVREGRTDAMTALSGVMGAIGSLRSAVDDAIAERFHLSD